MSRRLTRKEWEWVMESLQRLDFILRALVGVVVGMPKV